MLVKGVERPWWWWRGEPKQAYRLSIVYGVLALLWLFSALFQRGAHYSGAWSALWALLGLSTLWRGVATQRVLNWEEREF